METILNQCWDVICTYKKWQNWLEKFYHFRMSSQLRIFSWSLIFHGLSCKAKMAKMNITSSCCVVCGKEETVKHTFWECSHAQEVQHGLEGVIAPFLGDHLWWNIPLLGDANNFPCHLVGMWHVVRYHLMVTLRIGISLNILLLLWYSHSQLTNQYANQLSATISNQIPISTYNFLMCTYHQLLLDIVSSQALLYMGMRNKSPPFSRRMINMETTTIFPLAMRFLR